MHTMMKAITIWQPWASLIACGAKRYETRGWATNYRGPILIHAGKKPYNLGDIDFGVVRGFMSAAESALGIWEANNSLRGAIIATAEIVDCLKIASRTAVSGSPIEASIYKNGERIPITGDELLFGDWTPGQYAFELADVKMLPEPIPAKGRQGLWNWEG